MEENNIYSLRLVELFFYWFKTKKLNFQIRQLLHKVKPTTLKQIKKVENKSRLWFKVKFLS